MSAHLPAIICCFSLAHIKASGSKLCLALLCCAWNRVASWDNEKLVIWTNRSIRVSDDLNHSNTLESDQSCLVEMDLRRTYTLEVIITRPLGRGIERMI